jgi:peptide deformylase
MAVREMKIYPEPVLRERCSEIEKFGADLACLMDDLAESMYFHKGVGLAAPQIGEPMRAVVVDVAPRDGEPALIEMINPEVVSRSRNQNEYEEGCLSFPGEAQLVIRPAEVVVRAQDRQGRSFEIEADGLLATALQHEIDHLDGILFIDHISRLRRSLVERRMKKRARAVS